MTTTITYTGGFLRIHDAKIDLFGMQGGALWRLVNNVTQTGQRSAILLAPKRSGELAASIERRRPSYSKINRTATGYFAATAPHADAVIFGTLGANIVPRFREFMRLRPGNGYPFMFKKRVAGQRPNDFMERALRAALIRHAGNARGF